MAATFSKMLEGVRLPEAARRLGVHRATVNDMVRSERLPAVRDGAEWVIDRAVFEAFAAAYERPKNAPPRQKRGELLATTESVLTWLRAIGPATVAELDQVVDLHEGNIRKHLLILEARSLAHRDRDGSWSLTEAGEAARTSDAAG
ncbi:MAG TPA: helix-turn-helix domain-containing protein [Microthrixaceae bacterium]|nr:helix-turn-helix domain-containing protein [Microthrixaceae bacterium]